MVQIVDGIPIWGEPDQSSVQQIKRCVNDNAAGGALMADHHKGYSMPIGGDESPHVYKRLPDVLREHANTIRIVHTLRPIGVAMAGEDEFDPYKD